MTEIIKVENLIKRYKNSNTNAVDDITFSVGEGEFFSMLGPNGAGKTTTLSILNSTLNHTSGSVLIDNHDIYAESTKVREKIGVIFQSPSLDVNLTAEENIRFHSVLYGYIPFSINFKSLPNRYQRRVKELSNLMGLEKDLSKPISAFSGGMKRKLEIIIGLIHNPKILFLDEPTIGLDPLTRKNLWDYLLEIKKKGETTIFLTTHYIEEAEESDHVMIINKGKIVSFGTPTELKSDLIEEYVVISSLNNEFLRQELINMNVRFEGDGPFKVYIQENKLQNLFQKIKTKLSLINVHNPTLEQVYLKIIGDAKHEGN
ncbi:MAG: ABC transporter ATP-binding protein [Proteobacteria bacterium]|nr:ABC transporter ATP-binding protein [Pseudomonadota bacterium]